MKGVAILLLLVCACLVFGVDGKDETPVEFSLLNWLHEKGAREVLPGRSKVELTRPILPDGTVGERGLVATKDISPGETVMSIPFSACMVLQPEDSIPFEGAGPDMAFIAKTLRERKKGENSSWSQILSVFPEKIPIPWLSLDPLDYSEIQVAATIRRLKKLTAHLHGVYEECDKSVLGGASLQEFLWGEAMFFTRHFSIALPRRPGESESRRLTLYVPLGDLSNLEFQDEYDRGDVEWEEETFEDKIELKALRHIKKGEEVHEIYFRAATEDYYLMQGFVPDFNPFDAVTLFQSIEEAVFWLIEYVERGGDVGRNMDASGRFKDPWIFTRMIAIAHYASADAMEAINMEWDEEAMSGTDRYATGEEHCEKCLAVGRRWRGSTRVLAVFGAVWKALQSEPRVDGPAVTRPEDKALGPWAAKTHAQLALVVRCHELLQSYPTTIEEDAELLKTGKRQCSSGNGDANLKQCKWKDAEELTDGLKAAIKFRMEHKRLLRSLVKLWDESRG